jgi:hypothetical protein
MPPLVGALYLPLDEVVARLFEEISGADLDRLAHPSRISWRDLVGEPAKAVAQSLVGIIYNVDLDRAALPSQRTWRDVFAAWDKTAYRSVANHLVAELRAGRRALDEPVIQAVQALRWVNRTVRRGVPYNPDALGVPAEAYAERYSAWLGHRWRLPQTPTPGTNAAAIFQLAELINAQWQASTFELFGRHQGRGSPQRIEPIGRVLHFRPDRDRGEWVADMVSRDRQNIRDDSDLWQDLTIPREAVASLVAAVKRQVKTILGSRPGVRTTKQEKAEEEAGRRIAALKRRPIATVKVFLARLTREIPGLTGAAAARQWRANAKPEWRKRGRRPSGKTALNSQPN